VGVWQFSEPEINSWLRKVVIYFWGFTNCGSKAPSLQNICMKKRGKKILKFDQLLCDGASS